MRQHDRSARWNTRIPRGYRRAQIAAKCWTSVGSKLCGTWQACRVTPCSQCDPPWRAHFSSASKNRSASVAACARAHRWQASTRSRELQPEQKGPQANIIHQLGLSTLAHVRVCCTHTGSAAVFLSWVRACHTACRQGRAHSSDKKSDTALCSGGSFATDSRIARLHRTSLPNILKILLFC